MQARRAARELALILFSQIDFTQDASLRDFQETVVKSVRTLTNSSIEDLESISKEI